MFILNFANQLTADELTQVILLSGTGETVLERRVHSGRIPNVPLPEQAIAQCDALHLTYEEWVLSQMVVVPPPDGLLAALILAEIAGRSGFLPSVVSFDPIAIHDLTDQRTQAHHRSIGRRP